MFNTNGSRRNDTFSGVSEPNGRGGYRAFLIRDRDGLRFVIGDSLDERGADGLAHAAASAPNPAYAAGFLGGKVAQNRSPRRGVLTRAARSSPTGDGDGHNRVPVLRDFAFPDGGFWRIAIARQAAAQ